MATCSALRPFPPPGILTGAGKACRWLGQTMDAEALLPSQLFPTHGEVSPARSRASGARLVPRSPIAARPPPSPVRLRPWQGAQSPASLASIGEYPIAETPAAWPPMRQETELAGAAMATSPTSRLGASNLRNVVAALPGSPPDSRDAAPSAERPSLHGELANAWPAAVQPARAAVRRPFVVLGSQNVPVSQVIQSQPRPPLFGSPGGRDGGAVVQETQSADTASPAGANARRCTQLSQAVPFGGSFASSGERPAASAVSPGSAGRPSQELVGSVPMAFARAPKPRQAHSAIDSQRTLSQSAQAAQGPRTVRHLSGEVPSASDPTAAAASSPHPLAAQQGARPLEPPCLTPALQRSTSQHSGATSSAPPRAASHSTVPLQKPARRAVSKSRSPPAKKKSGQSLWDATFKRQAAGASSRSRTSSAGRQAGNRFCPPVHPGPAPAAPASRGGVRRLMPTPVGRTPAGARGHKRPRSGAGAAQVTPFMPAPCSLQPPQRKRVRSAGVGARSAGEAPSGSGAAADAHTAPGAAIGNPSQVGASSEHVPLAADDESRRRTTGSMAPRRLPLTFGAALRSLSQRMSGQGSVLGDGVVRGDGATSMARGRENSAAAANASKARKAGKKGVKVGQGVGSTTPQQPSITRFFSKQSS